MNEMRLLVLGGTSFVGRAVVVEALRRGHQVTTFNRGHTMPDVLGVHVLRGDRSSVEGLGILTGRRFDAVIDPGGQVPVQILHAAQALHRTVPFYAYVSSAAVYRDWTRLPWTEDAHTHPGVADDDGDPADMLTLGPRKAGCELAVRQLYGDDAALVVRPGLIVGPYDNIGMLPWWLSRIHHGGRVLAPGAPQRPLQLIDARDLANFLLDRVEGQQGGVFNTMPNKPVNTIGECLQSCVATTGGSTQLTWVDDDFLLEHGAMPWNELPFWLPAEPNPAAAWPIDASAARVAGLRCRPLGDTVHDTWNWLRSGGMVRPGPGTPTTGINADKELRILQEWANSVASIKGNAV